MELTVPPHRLGLRADSRGTRRVFSLTSDPRDAGRHDGGHVTFGLRLPEPPAIASTFKGSLNALRPGERIRATRIGGDFVLPSGPEPLLLMAGGVGITPFMSQLRDLTTVEPDRDVVLIYAASTPAELGYRQELMVLATSMPNLRVLVLASEDAGIGEYLGSGYPSADQLAVAAPDLAVRRIYVSGSPAFVAQAKASAKAAGGTRVRTDTFLGY
jgi:ferredoxin-NADP reductase